MALDSQTLLALVAIINAVAAGIAQVIAAIGHIQRPRTVTTAESFQPAARIIDEKQALS